MMQGTKVWHLDAEYMPELLGQRVAFFETGEFAASPESTQSADSDEFQEFEEFRLSALVSDIVAVSYDKLLDHREELGITHDHELLEDLSLQERDDWYAYVLHRFHYYRCLLEAPVKRTERDTPTPLDPLTLVCVSC